MKVNPMLMELARGEWLMDVNTLSTWSPIAYKILSGEDFSIDSSTASIMTVVDSKGVMHHPDKDGHIETPKGSVAIINMIGPILKYGDWCAYGADDIVNALKAADNNPNIKGTVFIVDGPGGAVSAIGPFIEFAKTKTKPVIGLADEAFSLHYWALCAVSDYKMADNNVSAGFGSVGVVASYLDNREHLEKLGFKFHDIYPDESKHKNEAVKLALEGKYDLIKKEHLSPVAIKFQDAVRAACPSLKEATGVLTGKTFSADKALEYGMIDGIGSLDKAIEKIHVLSEINALQ
ncbi:MAG: hypothetical protein BM557_01250 [Flavobacterium sp. MedPE-SWcel]|uniref:S49 family peptidase n=1 Tax=uncultured Flavobacterium sp. TaxID=165435 RepID=UPI0009244A3C|nr:S49 family peptidase [uncultured Flavobacterium sp.]OIQ22033.1 MAG: hypothetical protein BM557_01250 [Flavobacterium sp. MedPE-SWcel]